MPARFLASNVSCCHIGSQCRRPRHPIVFGSACEDETFRFSVYLFTQILCIVCQNIVFTEMAKSSCHCGIGWSVLWFWAQVELATQGQAGHGEYIGPLGLNALHGAQPPGHRGLPRPAAPRRRCQAGQGPPDGSGARGDGAACLGQISVEAHGQRCDA